MSRSRLRNKWVRCRERLDEKEGAPRSRRNHHRLDEMPRNKASRLVASHCAKNVDWLEHPGSFGGHKPRAGGHCRVSGMVRASLKREFQKGLSDEEPPNGLIDRILSGMDFDEVLESARIEDMVSQYTRQSNNSDG